MVTRAVDLDRTLDEAHVTVTMTCLDQIWDRLFPAEQIRIVHSYGGENVMVSPHDTEVRLRQTGIERLVLELRPDPAGDSTRPWHDPDGHPITRIP